MNIIIINKAMMAVDNNNVDDLQEWCEKESLMDVRKEKKATRFRVLPGNQSASQKAAYVIYYK